MVQVCVCVEGIIGPLETATLTFVKNIISSINEPTIYSTSIPVDPQCVQGL